MQDKTPDYAHADPCRQETRSVYIFDLFVSRPSAPDLTTKLDQLDFSAQSAPAHLSDVNVGVFFEQAQPPPAPAAPATPPHSTPHSTLAKPCTAQSYPHHHVPLPTDPHAPAQPHSTSSSEHRTPPAYHP